MPQGRGSRKQRRNKRSKRAAVTERRVLLQEVGGLDAHGGRTEGNASGRPTGKGMHDRGKTFGRAIVRLTEDGIDWGTWPQDGDLIGYPMHPYRGDDCFQAAIATCVQVPIEQVPDPALDRRVSNGESVEVVSRTSWERIAEWANSQGMRMEIADELPTHSPRWIGVIEGDAGSRVGEIRAEGGRSRSRGSYWVVMPFQGHCVVMARERVLFDPSCSVRAPKGASGAYIFDPSEITYGIVFHKEE